MSDQKKHKSIPFDTVLEWGFLYRDPEDKTGDRWTFILHSTPDECLGMNDVPFHPQHGVGMHSGVGREWVEANKANRVDTVGKWRRVPKDVRRCVEQEIRDTAEGILDGIEVDDSDLAPFNEFDGRGADPVNIVLPEVNWDTDDGEPYHVEFRVAVWHSVH